MADLISKDKVLRCLKKSSEQIDWGQSRNGDAFKHYVGTIYRTIAEFKPEQPQWEKASKKLPTDRDWYLGIFQEADTGWINPIPFICDYVGKLTRATTKEGWIIRYCTDREVDDSGGYYYNLKCVAWRPLPELPEEVKQDG